VGRKPADGGAEPQRNSRGYLAAPQRRQQANGHHEPRRSQHSFEGRWLSEIVVGRWRLQQALCTFRRYCFVKAKLFFPP
jgi:hypothetical protein